MKRYALSREYRGNIGSPAITEQPEGAYVLYDDYAAVFDELRAEKAGLEGVVAAQAGEIERLREALRWNAAALQAACRTVYHSDEGDQIVIGNEFRTVGAILDGADAALAQEQS
ncbi:MAG TPA: hypothetical protein VNS29_03995 [Burkholderiaceae bacterium]|nr:hypothetical protein [Burkholderiaceae bacterium]